MSAPVDPDLQLVFVQVRRAIESLQPAIRELRVAKRGEPLYSCGALLPCMAAESELSDVLRLLIEADVDATIAADKKGRS